MTTLRSQLFPTPTLCTLVKTLTNICRSRRRSKNNKKFNQRKIILKGHQTPNHLNWKKEPTSRRTFAKTKEIQSNQLVRNRKRKYRAQHLVDLTIRIKDLAIKVQDLQIKIKSHPIKTMIFTPLEISKRSGNLDFKFWGLAPPRWFLTLYREIKKLSAWIFKTIGTLSRLGPKVSKSTGGVGIWNLPAPFQGWSQETSQPTFQPEIFPSSLQIRLNLSTLRTLRRNRGKVSSNHCHRETNKKSSQRENKVGRDISNNSFLREKNNNSSQL